jgi:site-specific DNA-methyltransferase (adenine-specific)
MPGDLFYGDNLEIMQRHIHAESIDLIYLDPPFNSDETYGLIHKGSQAQQDAFWDSWHWNEESTQAAYVELTDGGHGVPRELSEMMVALKGYLYPKHKDMLAYLSMMSIRLVAMKRILRNTGSLYLHCDPTAAHYLKLILDMIFGPENFRSEITWKRTTAHNSAKRYGPVHDTIFYYAKNADRLVWNQQHQPYDEKYLATKYRHVDLKTGQRYRLSDMTGAGLRKGDSGKAWGGFDPSSIGRHWQPPSYCYWKYTQITGDDLSRLLLLDRLTELDRVGLINWPDKSGGRPEHKRYLEDMPGVPLQDVWTDIEPINSRANERIGWATQKPLPLLQRIIEASSNEGDLVLDPFCGCGTTIEACEELERKWIGIDIAIRAIDVMKDRLDVKFQRRIWTEHGEPKDIEQAERLAKNEYDFQWWAVRMLGGQPPKGEKKKGADDGVDGELRLIDDSGTIRRGLISVKAGHNLNPDFVKTLHDNVREKKYDFGVLATMHDPTQGMRDKAADYGNVLWASEYKGKLAHKIRIITAGEWLPPNEVRWPGKVTRPRSQSSPPPPEARPGDTLHLPFTPAKTRTRRAKSLQPSDHPEPARAKKKSEQ